MTPPSADPRDIPEAGATPEARTTAGAPDNTSAWSELRRAAPETRAVLAGLLVVLGAWIGPGLQRGGTDAAEGQPVATGAGVPPAVGGDAYAAAVGTATAPEASEAATAADED